MKNTKTKRMPEHLGIGVKTKQSAAEKREKPNDRQREKCVDDASKKKPFYQFTFRTGVRLFAIRLRNTNSHRMEIYFYLYHTIHPQYIRTHIYVVPAICTHIWFGSVFIFVRVRVYMRAAHTKSQPICLI